jgi:hypothetical protein
VHGATSDEHDPLGVTRMSKHQSFDNLHAAGAPGETSPPPACVWLSSGGNMNAKALGKYCLHVIYSGAY